MSAQNPESGIDALIGKTYTLKGRECRNTILAMIALESAGISLNDIRTRSYEASVIVSYAFLSSKEDVVKAIGDKTVYQQALLFASDWTPEDLGQSIGILFECITRFNHSITSYYNPSAKGKNELTG